jgi:thiol-disulfide isomerase/thioredoxin
MWAGFAAAVFAAAATAYLIWPSTGTSPHIAGPPLAGEMRKFIPTQPPAPAAAVSFTDAAGRQIGLPSLNGKVVLVNFWATWCAPCVAEMPSLDRLQAELGGPEFEVVALSLDKTGTAAVGPFFQKQEIRHLKTYLDPAGSSLRPMEVSVLPTSILIDRSGREVGRMKGEAKWDGPDAKGLIRHYMDRGSR